MTAPDPRSRRRDGIPRQRSRGPYQSPHAPSALLMATPASLVTQILIAWPATAGWPASRSEEMASPASDHVGPISHRMLLQPCSWPHRPASLRRYSLPGRPPLDGPPPDRKRWHPPPAITWALSVTACSFSLAHGHTGQPRYADTHCLAGHRWMARLQIGRDGIPRQRSRGPYQSPHAPSALLMATPASLVTQILIAWPATAGWPASAASIRTCRSGR